MILRVFDNDSRKDIEKVCLAANAVRTPLTISVASDYNRLSELKSFNRPIIEESLDQFIESIGTWERIRTLSSDIDMRIFEKAAEQNKYVASAKVLNEGRLELLHYVKEQSISYEYHRYGSIIEMPKVEMYNMV